MNEKINKTYLKISIISIIMAIYIMCILLFFIPAGLWHLIVINIVSVVLLFCLIVKIFYDNTTYVCPHYDKPFKPTFKEFVRENNTLKPHKTGKLTCTECGIEDICTIKVT